MNTHISIAGINFTHPVILSSGPYGVVASGWRRLASLGAAGITTKACLHTARDSFPSPTIISTDNWSLAADNFCAPGYETSSQEIISYNQQKIAPLIVAVGGFSAEEFIANAKTYAALQPDMIELQFNFPNAQNNNIPFTATPDVMGHILTEVKKAVPHMPVSSKLSVQHGNLVEAAAACMAAGTSAITAINPTGPGMSIDLRSRTPILNAWSGAMTGKAIKPIAIQAIADIYRVTNGTIPIIGTGGVHTYEDVLEMMIAGASLVGVDDALYTDSDNTFNTIQQGIQAWCTNEGIDTIQSLIGSMHTTVQEQRITPGERKVPTTHTTY